MTNEQINAAIAEACGWSMEDGVWVWTADGIDCTYYELWDWANDLNAMHEAEKVLTDAQCVFFRTYLREQLGPHPASLYVYPRQLLLVAYLSHNFINIKANFLVMSP